MDAGRLVDDQWSKISFVDGHYMASLREQCHSASCFSCKDFTPSESLPLSTLHLNSAIQLLLYDNFH
ncbi:hypothetical protein T03_898 [Trichinella britovi]|uniref:Uncharacterized protein n=2 Tax=Trichinella TaxID=6333 RepID=A0A0V1CLP6_TRIBR|nr:hypothetical protein T03_898 [Trichinella britovi]